MGTVLLYLIVFLYGIVIGSFLNVCILRIPIKESIVTKRSHCVKCGHELAWYDLFPLFSYLFLRGKCRYCGEKISAQYPIVEGLNGLLWVLTFVIVGWEWESVFICLIISALIVVTIVDWRTFEIPFGVVIYLTVIGVIHLAYVIICRQMSLAAGNGGERVIIDVVEMTMNDGTPFTMEYTTRFIAGIAHAPWYEYVIGFFAVSVPLLLIYLISKGKGIGGGDIKLMAAAGLLLGWKLILLALIAGCLYGSVIHIIRMKVSKEGRVLAMGPYLSAGILTALWFGEPIIEWYTGMFVA